MGWKRGDRHGAGQAPRVRPRLVAGLVAALVASLAVLASLGPVAAAKAVTSSAGDPTTSAATAGIKFKATGYFYIAQQDGRSWFVTPTGQPFYSAGIDHVSADPDTDQVTGQCPYCEAIASQYKSTADWATATVARLRSYGFNSLGPFADDSIFASKMPYSVQLSMASGDDWFASSFVTNADEVAATQVAPLADDPNLIGYYTDSELDWGPSGSDLKTELANYLALPAGSPGLAVAERYKGNPNGFVYALATRYFSVTTAAVRKYDTHHLILGVKAEAQEIQPQLLEAASHYVNVFSIDDYNLRPGFAQAIDRIWPQYLPVTSTFSNFESYVKVPIMVGEYSFIAKTAQTPDTVPGVYAVYATQQDRADAYTDYIAPLYEDAPWVVGDEWFEYVDEPKGGRFDGENNNFGVVDVENRPYQDLVTQMELGHSIAPDHLVQSGPICDSWAEGSKGVTCTAHVTYATYPPSIATGSLPTGAEGTAYSNSLLAVGGRPTYRFSLVPGATLPKGLYLDGKTGVVSGTPRTYGAFTFGIKVTDSTSPTSRTSSRVVSLKISPLPVSIKTSGLPRAFVGTAYSEALSAVSGAPPYSWAVVGGALPPGLTLDADGSLKGTPTTAGTFGFTVEVTDSYHPPDTAKRSLSLLVSPARGT